MQRFKVISLYENPNHARLLTPTAFANFSPGLSQPWKLEHEFFNSERVEQLAVTLANTFGVLALFGST